MKIALFLSGHVRTLFYKFYKNIDLIKSKVQNCELDVFYSFWDDFDFGGNINDPWHIKSDNFIQPEVNIKNINDYFISHGVKNVQGEIESINIMKSILKDTNFLPENNGKNFLSSQYYKKNRVIEKYYNDEYDFYIQIRSDIIINDFLNEYQIQEIKDKKILVINKYFWYNGLYDGENCNEMIMCSGSKIFKQVNQIYLSEKRLSEQLPYHYGELITGTYINNLLFENVIDNMLLFDFEYRVIR